MIEDVVTPTGPRVLTRFPAEELLVTGKMYVRGIDLLEGKVVVTDDVGGNGGGTRTAAVETG